MNIHDRSLIHLLAPAAIAPIEDLPVHFHILVEDAVRELCELGYATHGVAAPYILLVRGVDCQVRFPVCCLEYDATRNTLIGDAGGRAGMTAVEDDGLKES